MNPKRKTPGSILISCLLLSAFCLLAVLGCELPSKKAKRLAEEKATANAGKEIVLVLTTGDRVQGKILRETDEGVTLLGKAGDGLFPKALIARTEEPKPPEVEVFKPQPPTSKYDEQGPMPYAAIRGMKVFHKATCTLLTHQPKYMIIEYSTRQEAVNDGLKPCGTCNP